MRKIICDLCEAPIEKLFLGSMVQRSDGKGELVQVRLARSDWRWVPERSDPLAPYRSAESFSHLPDLCNKCIVDVVLKPIIEQLDAESK